MFLPFSLKRILPSIVHTFLNPCSLHALLTSYIQLAVKLSVIDIPESFIFFLFEKTFLPSLYRTNLPIIGLFFHGSGFPIRWLLLISFTETSVSILSFVKLETKSSVISSLFFHNPWTNIQFLLEYCSWSLFLLSKISTLPFRVLTVNIT